MCAGLCVMSYVPVQWSFLASVMYACMVPIPFLSVTKKIPPWIKPIVFPCSLMHMYKCTFSMCTFACAYTKLPHKGDKGGHTAHAEAQKTDMKGGMEMCVSGVSSVSVELSSLFQHPPERNGFLTRTIFLVPFSKFLSGAESMPAATMMESITVESGRLKMSWEATHVSLDGWDACVCGHGKKQHGIKTRDTY